MSRHHKAAPQRRLDFITTEMIDLPDYGYSAKFPLIGQNTAITRFVRDTWAEIKAAEIKAAEIDGPEVDGSARTRPA